MNVYSSFRVFRPLKHSAYHNAGKPRRLLCDDGTDYNKEKNLSPKQVDVRRQLERLERLEKLQLKNNKNRS